MLIKVKDLFNHAFISFPLLIFQAYSLLFNPSFPHGLAYCTALMFTILKTNYHRLQHTKISLDLWRYVLMMPNYVRYFSYIGRPIQSIKNIFNPFKIISLTKNISLILIIPPSNFVTPVRDDNGLFRDGSPPYQSGPVYSK